MSNQSDANAFDQRLYGLIATADRLAGNPDKPVARLTNNERAWSEVHRYLSTARVRVRDMMSEADRKGTEG